MIMEPRLDFIMRINYFPYLCKYRILEKYVHFFHWIFLTFIFVCGRIDMLHGNKASHNRSSFMKPIHRRKKNRRFEQKLWTQRERRFLGEKGRSFDLFEIYRWEKKSWQHILDLLSRELERQTKVYPLFAPRLWNSVDPRVSPVG